MTTSNPPVSQLAAATAPITTASCAPRSRIWPARSQCLTDFALLTIVFRLLWHGNHQAAIFAPLIAAVTILIYIHFGVYTRDATPLSIGITANLVRGAAYSSGVCVLTWLLLQKQWNWTVVAGLTVAPVILTLQRELAPALSAYIPRHGTARRLARLLLRSDAPLLRDFTPFDIHNHSQTLSSYSESLGRRCGNVTISRSVIFTATKNGLRRMIDLAISSSLLILLSPILVITAVCILIDTGGPVFFRQTRIGKDGRPFLMWKFRSMNHAVPKYQRSPVSDSDPRLTRVGRVIRRLSIDELPQLLNVLLGHMCLVGPRPEMPFIVNGYSPSQRLRLAVPPGITGLWQISPARAEPIHHNLHYDLYYILHQSIFLDCAILVRTTSAVVRGIGAR